MVVEVADQPCQRLYESHPVLLGYDVVQYHYIDSFRDGGVAVRGIPEHAYNWKGYQFWFSSNENRQKFIGNPEKYAPAWGGFCSWGIAREMPPQWPWEPGFLGPPASPWEGWLIVNGTLVFNIWAGYSDMFLEEVESNMRSAAERWEAWFADRGAAAPFNTHCIGHGPLQNWCLSQQPAPWQYDLPECVLNSSIDNEDNDCLTLTLSGGVFPPNCSNVISSHQITGGGIVGNNATQFSSFGNSRFSPHQKRLIVACSVAAPIVVILIILGVLIAFRGKDQRSSEIAHKTTNKSEDDNGDSDDLKDSDNRI